VTVKGTADGAVAIGRDQIRELLGSRASAAVRHRHILTSFRVEVDGDRATARSDWYLVQPGPGASWEIEGAGRYDDQLVKTDDGWLFSSRTISAAPR
jgi:hypothetical protein